MKRRTLLQTAGVAMLARPGLVRAASATTLKFIPYADLALTDPAVSAMVTRNHVMMVYDTLFAMNEFGKARPQMLSGYSVEPDGLTWTLTLRDGLKFHDGTPVLARDVVASLRRWWVNDTFGQAVAAATNELSAQDDTRVQFRLKRRFHLLPDALAHPTNLMAVIMPERLAVTPAAERLKEIVGSGPFRFLAAERVPGARNVYAKFADYVPRSDDEPSFCAGPRVAYFDRVEWLTTPDLATQASALHAGEVDWVEQPLMDLVGSLRANRGLKVEVVETKGLTGFLRFNQLYPPSNNPRIRQVLLKAINQTEFMEAVVGGNASFDARCGFFPAGSPCANDTGLEALGGRNNLTDLKRDLAAAGYAGEKIIYLSTSDVPRISAISQVGADMLRKLGMNVDEVFTDWGTAVQRVISKQPLDKGGWSMYASFTGGYDTATPSTHGQLRANGARAGAGWPVSPALEALRDAWMETEDPAAQLSIAQKIQAQAMIDVPYLPLGSYFQPVAYQASLTDMKKGLIQFTGVRRTA